MSELIWPLLSIRPPYTFLLLSNISHEVVTAASSQLVLSGCTILTLRKGTIDKLRVERATEHLLTFFLFLLLFYSYLSLNSLSH